MAQEGSTSNTNFLQHLKKEQDAESRAVQWVEQLLEPSITYNTLLQAAQYLEPRHYNDVVEERFIEKLCGWPQCDKHLVNVPSAQYHISVKQKKVLDISERKKFCSSSCYHSSKYFASQLSMEPIWTRTSEFSVTIKLLEVQEESTNDEPTQDEKKPTEQDKPVLTEKTVLLRSLASDTKRPDPMLTLLQKSVEIPGQDGKSNESSPMKSDIKIIEHKVDSINLSHQGTDEEEEEEGETIIVGAFRNQYSNKTLTKVDEFSVKDKLYHAFTTWTVNRAHSRCDDKIVETEKTQEVEVDPIIFLPVVHNIETSQIQQNIFLNQLKTNLTQISSKLDLTIHAILPELTSLAKTFSLTRDTITFKPNEWRLLISIMISSLDLADIEDNPVVLQWLETADLQKSDMTDLVQYLSARIK